MKRLLLSGFFASSLIFTAQSLQAQSAPVIQWDKTFGTLDHDYFQTIRQTTDGGYILGGFTDGDVSGDKTTPRKSGCSCSDFWIIRLDAAGNKLWDKSFGGNSWDNLASLQQTSDGGFILGGGSLSNNTGDKTQNSHNYSYDYWIVKLDSSGNKLWDKAFGGNENDKLQDLIQTSDGGYILAGTSESNISGDKTEYNKGIYNNSADYWIVKLDSAGNKVWDKTIGGDFNDTPFKIKQTLDGGYIIGGLSASNLSGDKSEAGRGESDYWIVKLNSNGVKQWDKTLGGSDKDIFGSLSLTLDGGYFIAGHSESGISHDKSEASKGSSDYWVVKLDANGQIVWDKTIGGNGQEWLYAALEAPDGSFFIAGESASGIYGDKSQVCQGLVDYWIIKLSPTGNKLWDKTVGGNLWDRLMDVQLTSDGGFILGGYSDTGISGDKSQPSQGGRDYWIVKLGSEVLGITEKEFKLPLSISPNPNHGKFQLQISDLKNAKAEVTVTDLLGRTIMHQELKAYNNQINQELTIPETKGMYLLQVKSGEQVSTRKIVVE